MMMHPDDILMLDTLVPTNHVNILFILVNAYARLPWQEVKSNDVHYIIIARVEKESIQLAIYLRTK